MRFHCWGKYESSAARLEEAVVAYGQALKERTPEHVPDQWTATQESLALTLRTLARVHMDRGERTQEIARLKEAVHIYRNLLQEYARRSLPLDWTIKRR